MIWLAKIVAFMLNTGLVKRTLRAQVSHGTSCCNPTDLPEGCLAQCLCEKRAFYTTLVMILCLHTCLGNSHS